MALYLVDIDNVDLIDVESDNIITACNNRSGVRSEVFFSSNFIKGTGYMKKVRDEIDFVLKSHEVDSIGSNSFEEFVRLWNFEQYLDYDLDHLSGGWNKFLGLALFLNIKSECKIMFDGCRQLSDVLISRLIDNLESNSNEDYFLVEYDQNLLKKYSLKGIRYENGLMLN